MKSASVCELETAPRGGGVLYGAEPLSEFCGPFKQDACGLSKVKAAEDPGRWLKGLARLAVNLLSPRCCCCCGNLLHLPICGSYLEAVAFIAAIMVLEDPGLLSINSRSSARRCLSKVCCCGCAQLLSKQGHGPVRLKRSVSNVALIRRLSPPSLSLSLSVCLHFYSFLCFSCLCTFLNH